MFKIIKESEYSNFDPIVIGSNKNVVTIKDKNSDFEEDAIMKIGANGKPMIEWDCYYQDNGRNIIASRIAKDSELKSILYDKDFYNKANDVAFKYLYDKGIIEYNDEEFGGWILNLK